MKVILLQDVAKVGQRGTVAQVKSGFAQNFLIPRGLAEVATSAKEKAAEKLQERRAAELSANQEALKSALAKMERPVSIPAKANEKGHLFEGVNVERLAEAVSAAINLKASANIFTLENPLKEVGKHNVAAKVGEWKGSVAIEIIAE